MGNNPDERFSIFLPLPVGTRLREIAGERGLSLSATMRMALGLLDVAERAREEGLYVGTTRDREQLDTVMVLPL